MRATVELHENSLDVLPPVKAKVTLGREDLSIKVNKSNVPIPYSSRKRSGLWLSNVHVCSVCLSLRLATEEEEFL